MPRYRKKPITINAFRIGYDNLPDWFLDKMSDNSAEIYPVDKTEMMRGPFETRKIYAVIHTLEGDMTADYGDYVIQGINGEIYPCKPDIFKQTYEKIEE